MQRKLHFVYLKRIPLVRSIRTATGKYHGSLLYYIRFYQEYGFEFQFDTLDLSSARWFQGNFRAYIKAIHCHWSRFIFLRVAFVHAFNFGLFVFLWKYQHNQWLYLLEWVCPDDSHQLIFCFHVLVHSLKIQCTYWAIQIEQTSFKVQIRFKVKEPGSLIFRIHNAIVDCWDSSHVTNLHESDRCKHECWLPHSLLYALIKIVTIRSHDMGH